MIMKMIFGSVIKVEGAWFLCIHNVFESLPWFACALCIGIYQERFSERE